MKFGVIDIVIIAFIIISALIGAKKGFFKRIGGFVAFAAAVIITVLVFKYAVNLITDSGLYVNLTESIDQWLRGKNENFAYTIGVAGEEGVNAAVSAIGIPTFLAKYLVGDVSAAIAENPDTTIAGYFAPTISSFIVTVACCLIIFLVLYIIFKVIVNRIKRFTDESGVGGFDRFLGLTYGLLKAVVIVCVIMEVVSILVNLPSIGDTINTFITKDMHLDEDVFSVGKFFYQNNPLLWLLDKVGLGNILSQTKESIEGAISSGK